MPPHEGLRPEGVENFFHQPVILLFMPHRRRPGKHAAIIGREPQAVQGGLKFRIRGCSETVVEELEKMDDVQVGVDRPTPHAFVPAPGLSVFLQMKLSLPEPQHAAGA